MYVGGKHRERRGENKMLDPRDTLKVREDELMDTIDEAVDNYVLDYIDEIAESLIENIHNTVDLDWRLNSVTRDVVSVDTFEVDEFNDHVKEKIVKKVLDMYEIEIKLVEK